MATIADLKALADEIGKIAYQYVIAEFKAQGHTLTGKFEQQVEFKVVETVSGEHIIIAPNTMIHDEGEPIH